MKFTPLFLILSALASLPAWAEVAHQPRAPGIESKGYVWNKPNKEQIFALKHKADPVKGKAAYRVCQGCHKADASGRGDADYPQLAGQHTTVLIKQLVDVRAGKRDNPKMHPFVGEWAVSTEEISDIAAYLNSLPIPTTNSKGDGKHLDRGFAVYEKSCANCHGDSGEGYGDKFYPMVASQHYDYLLYESLQIRDGGRRNANPKMVRIIKKYSDADLQAVADYMSRLPPPRGKLAPDAAADPARK
ncbi:MAG: cytochrome C [Rhodocyclaceae bacterium]|nr:MAG: cytochrome C [Rhodocyclaceae bacterium]